MVLEAITIVMKHNVFQFDDTFWLQLTGTAMGTSLACIYATIYYSYHEETSILPQYAHSRNNVRTLMPEPLMPEPMFTDPPLLLHARLIDDAIQVWDAAKLPTDLLAAFSQSMATTLKFGTLDWEVDEPSHMVNVLNLTITIQPTGQITTTTFVKPMNLHLYNPPKSAHPHGVLKSLIFGVLQRYWLQNTFRHDFVRISADFYKHLLNRGYTPVQLTPIFEEAAATRQSKRLRAAQKGEALWNTANTTPTDDLFLHWDYHPRNIGRSAIRQIFVDTLAQPLANANVTFDKLTIAYSTPRNLGQCLTKTQLWEHPSAKVSMFASSLEPPANL
jgi:hypothetical protein